MTTVNYKRRTTEKSLLTSRKGKQENVRVRIRPIHMETEPKLPLEKDNTKGEVTSYIN